MPFIWDDFEWKLVDDEDPYDKSRFVVARKLRVQPVQLNAAKDEFSIESIRRYFQKFGEIESIEMLPNSQSEAYVTFASDQIAYNVQSHHEYYKKIKGELPYEVEPADTWEQPSQKLNPPSEKDMKGDVEQTAEIFMLTEDCLLHLFGFLNLGSLVNMADVCKMFNRLLHNKYTFPRIRKYGVLCDSKTLAQIRRELLCVGRHITSLRFEAHYNHVDGHLIDNDHSSKYLKVIAQNVGQNIRQAFLTFRSDKPSRIMTIAPILQNLETLVFMDFGKVSDIDFPALCPNLNEFHSNASLSMIACRKPWPSLRSLFVLYNYELETETLTSIVEKNPQLTSLGFGNFNNNNNNLNFRALLMAISEHLMGLEKLLIHLPWRNDRYRFMEEFDQLGELPNLREISLMSLEIDYMKNIIDHLPKFVNLRKVYLSAYSLSSETRDYERLLVNLTKQQPLLEELKLEFIPMEEETLVDIVRFGNLLKVLNFSMGIHSNELSFSDELAFKLVDALKSYRQEFDKPLQIFLSGYDILDKLEDAERKEIERFMQVRKEMIR